MYSLRKVSKFNLFNVLQLYKEKQLLIYPKEQLSQVWAGWLVSLSWKHKKKYWIILMNFKATDKTKDEVLFFPNLYPPFTLLPREFSYLPLKVYWSCNYPLGNLTESYAFTASGFAGVEKPEELLRTSETLKF